MGRRVLVIVSCTLLVCLAVSFLRDVVCVSVGNLFLNRALVSVAGEAGSSRGAGRAVWWLRMVEASQSNPHVHRSLLIAQLMEGDTQGAVQVYMDHSAVLEDDFVTQRYRDVLLARLYDITQDSDGHNQSQSYRAMLSLDPFNLYAYYALTNNGTDVVTHRRIPAVFERKAGEWFLGTVEFLEAPGRSLTAICDGLCGGYVGGLAPGDSSDQQFVVVKEAETQARLRHYTSVGDRRAIWVGTENWPVYLPDLGEPYYLWIRYFDNGRRTITVDWQGQSVTLRSTEDWHWIKVGEITPPFVEIIFRGTGTFPGLIDTMMITDIPSYDPATLSGTQ